MDAPREKAGTGGADRTFHLGVVSSEEVPEPLGEAGATGTWVTAPTPLSSRPAGGSHPRSGPDMGEQLT